MSEYIPRPQLKPDAVYAACRTCTAIYKAKYRFANKEKINAWHKKDRDEHPEKNARRCSEFQKAHPELGRARTRKYRAKDIEKSRARGREATKKWRLNNLGKWNAWMKRYRMQKIRAMPPWANQFFIEEAYDLAQRRNKVTGIKWHVDHIVPLRGKGVCGLHIPINLQVIPATANLLKSNRLEI